MSDRPLYDVDPSIVQELGEQGLIRRVEPEGIIRVHKHQIAAAINRLVALPEGTYAIVRRNDE